MEQTTARLRKTFHYPADNDSDDSLPDALDEEALSTLSPTPLYSNALQILSITQSLEQETLIRTLNQQNANLNILYTRVLLAGPVLSILPYLTTLINPRTSTLSVLSISSLLSTTYLLATLPPSQTNIYVLDALNKPKSIASSTRSTNESSMIQDEGPIARYLPLLNIGLCVMLGLAGMVFRGKEEVWWGFEWLPAGNYVVVLLAKVIMGNVDPETELGGLKYGYKGA